MSSEEGRSEGYSSGLQLHDKEKTLEFEPEKPVYSSKAKMKMEGSQAPVFLKQVSNVEVWQGDVARLSVTVTGSPTPKVQWFFNSMKLTSSTNCKLVFAGNDHSLILPYAGVEDEGEYTCVASNVHGETTCSAHLRVRQQIPGVPCFARKPDSIQCAPGLTAVFEYTVAGEPCPDVLWFKGSEELFSDARHSVAHHPDGSGSLTVQECMEKDTGLYICKAVSALGEATCSAELLVLPEEHAVYRQSPALQHSAVAEDQSPLSYEEAGELPAAEGALRLEAMKEPLALLQLQMSQEEHVLPREDILPSLPPACLAAQSVEEMLTQAATTQESGKLLAEPLETFPAGPQGVVPAAAMETRLPGCLGTVATQILLPKEQVIPETAEQMGALKTEDSQALLQVSSTTESHAIDGDHMHVLEGFQAMQGDLKAEPKLASELAFTGGQAVPLETASPLEAAEEDFAARIREGQALRFPLLLEEKQPLEEECVVSLVKEGKSCDETSELKSQQAETTMEAEIPLEQPLSAQVINSVTGHSQIKDVGAAAATADVASAGVPIETPTEILKGKEKREEIREEESTKVLEAKTGKVQVKESYPVIHSNLVDTVVEEGESVSLVSVITNVREVNWYFEGKLVSSGDKFKCFQDQDTYTLVISEACSDTHQGEYTCEALNQGGKRATAAKLTVVKRGWIMGIKYGLSNTLLY